MYNEKADDNPHNYVKNCNQPSYSNRHSSENLRKKGNPNRNAANSPLLTTIKINRKNFVLPDVFFSLTELLFEKK